MAAKAGAGSPVTAPSTVTGVPSAPKATGVVLNISTNTTASSAGKPHKMSKEAVMATGAPNPAIPSSRAPKQKPMTTSTTRRSFGKCFDHPRAERIETARRDRDVVEQQRADDDPHDRPQREHRAVDGRGERHAAPASAKPRRQSASRRADPPRPPATRAASGFRAAPEPWRWAVSQPRKTAPNCPRPVSTIGGTFDFLRLRSIAPVLLLRNPTPAAPILSSRSDA